MRFNDSASLLKMDDTLALYQRPNAAIGTGLQPLVVWSPK